MMANETPTVITRDKLIYSADHCHWRFRTALPTDTWLVLPFNAPVTVPADLQITQLEIDALCMHWDNWHSLKQKPSQWKGKKKVKLAISDVHSTRLVYWQVLRALIKHLSNMYLIRTADLVNSTLECILNPSPAPDRACDSKTDDDNEDLDDVINMETINAPLSRDDSGDESSSHKDCNEATEEQDWDIQADSTGVEVLCDYGTMVDPCKCCPHIKLNIAIYYMEYHHPMRLLRLRFQAVLLLSLVLSWRPSPHTMQVVIHIEHPKDR